MTQELKQESSLTSRYEQAISELNTLMEQEKFRFAIKAMLDKQDHNSTSSVGAEISPAKGKSFLSGIMSLSESDLKHLESISYNLGAVHDIEKYLESANKIFENKKSIWLGADFKDIVDQSKKGDVDAKLFVDNIERVIGKSGIDNAIRNNDKVEKVVNNTNTKIIEMNKELENIIQKHLQHNKEMHKEHEISKEKKQQKETEKAWKEGFGVASKISDLLNNTCKESKKGTTEVGHGASVSPSSLANVKQNDVSCDMSYFSRRKNGS